LDYSEARFRGRNVVCSVLKLEPKWDRLNAGNCRTQTCHNMLCLSINQTKQSQQRRALSAELSRPQRYEVRSRDRPYVQMLSPNAYDCPPTSYSEKGYSRPIQPVLSSTTWMRAVMQARRWLTPDTQTETSAAVTSSARSRLHPTQAPHLPCLAQEPTSSANPWVPTL